MKKKAISEAAQLMGIRGGAAHKAKYGLEFYRKIGRKGGKKRVENARIEKLKIVDKSKNPVQIAPS